jgi:hypothetical protein
MDFVTTTGLVIESAKEAKDEAAFLAYDTLIAAEIVKQRKEKKNV